MHLPIVTDGRWADWTGLDAGLDPATLIARYGRVTDQHTKSNRRYGDVIDLAAPAPLTGMRAWSSYGEVSLIEVGDPPAPGGVPAVLESLGPAGLVQPARYIRFRYETTDYVFPDRGLVLLVEAPYQHGLPDDPPDTTPRLVRAELFVPCDLETWEGRWARFGAMPPPLFAR
jgi:hypothetical protein